MIRGMLDSLPDTEPSVVEELGSMLKKHPELMDKMAKCDGKEEEKKFEN